MTASSAPIASSHMPPDPVLNAIAAHRVAWDMLAAASEDGEGGEDRVADLINAFGRLATTRPTTIAGYRDLADHLAWRIRQEGHEPGKGETVIEQAADMLLLGIEALSPLLIAGMPPAPITLAPSQPLDLAAMSIGELADLYHVSLQASRHLAALACTPACEGEDRTRIRVFIDLEADRLGDLSMACVETLRSRQSTTAEDRAERASILASHAARFHDWTALACLAAAEIATATRRA